MKIIAVAMPFDEGKSGISTYIINTFKALKATHHELIVFVQREELELFQAMLPDVEWRPVRTFWASPTRNLLWHLLVLPVLIYLEKADVLFLPAGNRRVLAHYPLPAIATVHDLSQFQVSQKYDIFRMLYIRYVIPFLLKRVSRISAISESTRRDLREQLHIPDHQIFLNPNGYDSKCFNTSVSPETLNQFRREWNIEKPYLLYVARIEHPGKNHLSLIKAYAALPEEIQQRYDLVFAGSDWNGAEKVHSAVREMGLSQRVRFLGFVPSEALPDLYRSATVYVFPSLYEGFGLPILEAMACGTPVVCSNRSSLPEIGGDAARYFDPQNIEDISQVVLKVLENPIEQDLMRTLGFEQVKQFSWEQHAKNLIDTFENLCPKNRRKQSHRISKHMKILGVDITNVRLHQALLEIKQRTIQKRKTRVYYVNADCLNWAFESPQYQQHLEAAELVYPDGIGVRLAAKMTGQRLCENLNGTDMFPCLCALSEQSNFRLFFLGARPGVADKMVRKLKEKYPKLQVAGSVDGYHSNEELPGILDKINQSQADMLFVALGVPKQEAWIEENFNKLQIPVIFGVGGLFDFYSGTIPRSPKILRVWGLEWVWRLCQEPQRLWRRYLIGNPKYLWRVWLYGRSAPAMEAYQSAAKDGNRSTVLNGAAPSAWR